MFTYLVTFDLIARNGRLPNMRRYVAAISELAARNVIVDMFPGAWIHVSNVEKVS